MKKLAVALLLMAFTVPAMAETYTWTDDSGTMNFTEDFGRIPKKYRKKARKVGDESAPAAPVETRETPKQKRADSPADLGAQGNSAAKAEKSLQYGGKSADEWKRQFAALRGELKSAETQLVETRRRLDDTSKMSRSEYLGLQISIRNVEKRVLDLRGKLQELEAEAAKAEVPADLRE